MKSILFSVAVQIMLRFLDFLAAKDTKFIPSLSTLKRLKAISSPTIILSAPPQSEIEALHDLFNCTNDDEWKTMYEHEKRKVYKRARKVLDALETKMKGVEIRVSL